MSFVINNYKFGNGTPGETVTWSFATTNFANEPYTYTSFLTGQFQTEVRAAIAAWEAVANIDFVEVADSAANDLRLGFVSDFPQFSWANAEAGGPGNRAGQAAVAWADENPIHQLTNADIAFDSREGWQTINGNILTGPGGTRFFSIALHEIGHTMGIDHNFTPGERSIMKPALDPSYNGLELVDIQAAQAIYGPAQVKPVAGSVSVGDMRIEEGNAGTKTLTFTVTRTGGTAAFNVDYATADGSATAGSDYKSAKSTLSFGAGINTQTVSIVITGDTVIEPTETFFLNLSNATNGATISDSQAVGTIVTEDIAPVAGSISIADFGIAEGNSGTTVATFTVTRTGGTAAFKVNYNTADGTATAGSDYKLGKGTLSFGAGIDTQKISIVISGDTTIESVETFMLNLSGATNGAIIADGQAIGTIRDDDASPNKFFQNPVKTMNAFGTNAGGWTSSDVLPRLLADVNGDGKADIVGFGGKGVYVSLATGGGTFAEKTLELSAFTRDAGGWTSDDKFHRALADVNGDGKADIVGFGGDGVYVSLATGGGHFAEKTFELAAFAPKAGGWTSDDKSPRELADVNGDGKADIVGFGADGVYVALATGGGHFGAKSFELAAFGSKAGGWTSDDKFHRELADVDGDHMADIVGFGSKGVYVSLATGGGHFAEPTLQFEAFAPKAGGWVSDDKTPRQLADVNGDHMADIIGFGGKGVYVSLATGDGHFAAPDFDLAAFAPKAGGWTSDDLFHRDLADVTGDGKADIVGFGSDGVHVSISHALLLL